MIDSHLTPIFITIIVGVFFIVVYYAITKRINWITRLNSTGFSSFIHFTSYFKTAIQSLTKERSLFLLPLIFIIINQLIQFGVQSFQLWRIGALSGSSLRSIFGEQKFWVFTLTDLLKTLKKAINALDFGYFGAFSGYLVLVATLLTIAFYQIISERLESSGYKPLAFFRKTLRIALLSAAIMAVPLAMALIFQMADFGFCLFNLFILWLSIFSLLLVSLLEAFLIGGAITRLKRNSINVKEQFNQAFVYLRSLFMINLILSLPKLLQSFWTGSAGLLLSSIKQPWLAWLGQSIIYTTDGLAYLVTITGFALPFFLMIHNTSWKQAIQLNFEFIKGHFLKYLIMVGTGVLLLSVPQALFIISSRLDIFIRMTVNILLTLIKFAFGYIFFIAMLSLCLEPKRNYYVQLDKEIP